jgi:hypothetical protein
MQTKKLVNLLKLTLNMELIRVDTWDPFIQSIDPFPTIDISFPLEIGVLK